MAAKPALHQQNPAGAKPADEKPAAQARTQPDCAARQAEQPGATGEGEGASGSGTDAAAATDGRYSQYAMRLPDAARAGLVAEKYDSFQLPGSGAWRAADFTVFGTVAGTFTFTRRTAVLRAGFGSKLFISRLCARWVLVMERRLRSQRPLRLLAMRYRAGFESPPSPVSSRHGLTTPVTMTAHAANRFFSLRGQSALQPLWWR